MYPSDRHTLAKKADRMDRYNRLKQKCANLQEEYDEQDKKVRNFRRSLMNQAQGSYRYQLQTEYEQEKEKLHDLEKELDELLEDLAALKESDDQAPVEREEKITIYDRQRRQDYLTNLITICDTYKTGHNVAFSLRDIYVEQEFAHSDASIDMYQPDSVRESIAQPNSYRYLLEQLLKDVPSCWVITGEPGIGKTTLLHMLTISSAEGSLQERVSLGNELSDDTRRVEERTMPRLPVFVELAKYAEYIRNLHTAEDTLFLLASYLTTLLDYKFRHIEPEYVKDMLNVGAFLLFFDALDEIGDTMLRDRVFENITTLMDNTPCCVVLSSRPTVIYKYKYSRKLLRVTIQELKQFDSAQIETYIDNFVKKQQQLNMISQPFDKPVPWAEALRKELHNQRLLEMLGNPLFLYMTVKTLSQTRQSLNIPDQQFDLYKRYVTHLLEERPDSRHKEIEHFKQRDYLDQIAYNLHERGLQQCDKTAVVGYVKEKFPELSDDDIDKALDFLITETGLLKKSDSDMYTFWHFSFQEFFTAEYLFRKSTASIAIVKPFLVKHLMVPWWRRVIIFYYAHSQPSIGRQTDWLIQELISGPENIFGTRALLAADCLMTTGKETHPYYYQVYQHVKQYYYHTRFFDLQDTLFCTIQRLSGDRFIQFLCEEIKSKDRERRIRATNALYFINDEEAKREIFASVKKFADESRIDPLFVKALLYLNTAQAQNLLLDLLDDPAPACWLPVVERILSTDREGWLEWLLERIDLATNVPWMDKAIQKLGRFSTHHIAFPLVRDVFARWLDQEREKYSVRSQNTFSRLILLFNAIYFPMGTIQLQFAIVALNDAMHSHNINLLLSIVHFLGWQPGAQVNDQFFELLHGDALERFGLDEQQSDLAVVEILCAWIRITLPEENLVNSASHMTEDDRRDGFEYITDCLESRASLFVWTQIVSFLERWGSEKYYNFLIGSLKIFQKDYSKPQTFRFDIINALYRMSTRRKYPVPGWLCSYLLEQIGSAHEDIDQLVVATTFLLYRGSREYIDQFLDIVHSADLSNALIRYVLTPECPSDLKAWVGRSRFLYKYNYASANVDAALQLQARIYLEGLSRSEIQELLLAKMRDPNLAVRRKAVEIACSKLETTKSELKEELSQALLNWLCTADRNAELDLMNDVIKRFGEVGTVELMGSLSNFLRDSDAQLQQTTFTALYSIAQRSYSMDLSTFTYDL